MKPTRDAVIFDTIAFRVEADQCLELLRIKPDSRHAGEFEEIFYRAKDLARPKAAFRVTTIQGHGDAHIDIDNVRFESRILRINLEKSPVVFPFVATCGHELGEWSLTCKGSLHLFWADTIMMLALGEAMSTLNKYLKERVDPAQISTMNPGSLEDWPLQQQSVLFDLLGQATNKIGVSLRQKYVMNPLKSVTGIQFVTEDEFFNCRLCPRKNCEGRRAPYDATLYETRYK
jgi:hypothetical protein